MITLVATFILMKQDPNISKGDLAALVFYASIEAFIEGHLVGLW